MPAPVTSAVPSEGLLQIGEVATRTDLSVRTIRHWEDIGLISPSARSRGGFRLYSLEDVARIRLLRYMKPLNFTLEQMRELLELRDQVVASGGAGDRGLVWPPSSAVADADTASRVVLDLERYTELAARRLQQLHQQIGEVEEFVAQLREEVNRGRGAS
ncbi:MerR family transcriptional regulator [Nakamurella flava]|uniref:MerR family transcriptional regulator n=1 Tax=Nakamurella flava TaxID=2576308 RepID=A0A4V6CU38_9ACTN|nr:MerR family transcriptional regulator [Nakamurella flava]TKV61665.1 MerR family transcriptional regulator [Nakamurella flava]